MSRSLCLVLLASASTAFVVGPSPARAQVVPSTAASGPASAPDSLAFPRQFVQWIFTAQGDSAYAHAGSELRASMQSADAVTGMAQRIQSRFGDAQGTVAEIQFDEGPLKVYIVAMRFVNAPEPGAWVVAYAPGTKVVERSSFTALSNVKSRYPQAKLP